MAKTTKTTLTELVNSEMINPAIQEYAVERSVAAPFMYWKDVRGKGTNTVSFPRLVADAVAKPGETTDLTSEALETTSVEISGTEIGLYRVLTDSAAQENILGAMIFNLLVRDAGRLAAKSLDDDIVALFLSISGQVGDTSSDPMTIAFLVQALARIYSGNMEGTPTVVLAHIQAEDLIAAHAASNATMLNGRFNIADTNSQGYVGSMYGASIWRSGLCDTVNTGANVVGCAFIRGDTDPMSAAFGAVLTRDVTTELGRIVKGRATEFGMSAKWGVGELIDESAQKIVSDADH